MSDSTASIQQLSLVLSSNSAPAKSTDAAAPQRKETPEGGQNVPSSGKVSPQATEQRQAVEQKQAAEQKVEIEEVAKAVSEITDYVQSVSRDLQFQVDKQTGSTIVTVLDHETKEVIRQIPSEEVLEMARHIAENAPDPVKGLLMNGEG